ncbi:MAG: serine O-acetyltransferase [Rhodospirillales bacterium]|jgi:serine O-acetyltransferase|nr:serine O-acetyltransferase [Rhodospirillales bacterium]MDP6884985.1 serine O-acetyltransferase [Rhodospirillales bacterium]
MAAIIARLRQEIDVIMERDPAARSRLEVVFCYPGFHAQIFHRLAHGAWKAKWYFLGRLLSHIGRMLTGIEIHPGATIGRRFFIDHGMGCVIGETTEIGDDVTLYQGVTLGGVSSQKKKRHPTIGDRAIIGSSAQVLGPITVGEDARIGANTVVLKDVPAGVTMVGSPARQVRASPREASEGFRAYGTPRGDIPDPVAAALDGLMGELESLRKRIEEVERDDANEPSPPAKPPHRGARKPS